MREKVFYLYDRYLKGSAIKTQLEDLSFFDTLPLDKFMDEKESRIRRIADYAIENCAFYSEFAHFNDFPLINKEIIRKQQAKFISAKFRINDLIPAVTSGSTGTPFKVYQDKFKKNRNTADTIHFAAKTGYTIGEPLFYLKIWNQHNKKSNLKYKLQNLHPVNVFDLSTPRIKRYINDWNNSKTSIAILGYASAILEIAKFLSNNKNLKKFRVHSIITMSEGLDVKSKEFISEMFDCKVYIRYSNVENGILAQNFEDSNLFLINSASYNIEIFKMDNNELEEDGKIGRIVITDYYNFGMPLIRYDTGDIGSMRKISRKGRTVEVLENIEGRRMDAIYDTSGNLLSSFIITNGMWAYPEINQYQFIQCDKFSYKFKISINREFEKEEELINQFKKYLGSESNVDVEYINEIPLLSSGKRKKVVNLMVDN